MTGKDFRRHSLKYRITLATLTIFVASMWALSYYASRMLREDIQNLLADQQFSTVSYVAGELNQKLQERIEALEKIAGAIDRELLENPAAMQQRLENRPIFLDNFNTGVMVLNRAGAAIADAPAIAGRKGTNYADSDAVHSALSEGKSAISRPMLGKTQHQPMFHIAAPIRDSRGQVIGALVGVTNLAKPNFLDAITEHRYGRSGGYLIVAPQHQLFITATDKKLVMQPIPAPGKNRMHDKSMQGFEGSGVAVSSRGEEELSSVKRIPVAGWFAVAILPTREAFAPIRDMQRRIVFAALFLTLLAGGLTWWVLKHQLAPLLGAVDKLAEMSLPGRQIQALPIVKQDEIGELVGGFNQLLETLSRSEQHFRAFFERSMVGMASTSPEKGWLEVNDRLCEILGYTRAELTRMTWAEITHPDDLHRQQAVFEDVLAGKADEYELNKRYFHKAGHIVHTHVAARLLRRKDGTPDYFVVLLEDVSERTQAENILKQERDLRKKLIESLPGIFYLFDSSGHFLLWNHNLEKVLKYSADEIANAHPLAFFEGDDQRLIKTSIRAAFEIGHASAEALLMAKDGAKTPYYFSGQRIDVGGQPALVGLGIDITELRRMAESLKTLNENLESRVKEETAKNLEQARLLIQQSRLAAMGEMIGNIAHQWRQPLNALGLVIANIKDANEYHELTNKLLDEQSRTARRLIEHMSATIDDFRNFFRPNRQKSPFTLQAAVDSALTMVDASLKNNQIGLSLHPAETLTVNGYESEFAQVVVNIVTNAKEAILENCPGAGKITLKIGQDNGRACLRISDNGGGIPPDILPKIFDPYFTTKEKGTGIGLYMSKMIMNNMDGDIDIRNIEGGVEVLIGLPLAA